MLFARGATVFAEEDEFGTLADIVVDPFTHRVTHAVVDPGGDHQQKRLVPIWLMSDKDGALRVALPDTHIRQLQRALDSDYMRLPAKLVTQDRVDRFKSVLALPHFADPSITMRPAGDQAAPMPITECEIRRSSWVVDVAGHVLGTVAGLLVHEDIVHSVVVRSGVVGHRHNVAVPIGRVSKVASHFVTLGLERSEFKTMPITKVVPTVAPLSFRPRELWREVLGQPTNKLWDDFEL